LLRGYGLGGDDDVGFIFTCGIVEDDDELVVAWLREEGWLVGLVERGGLRGKGGNVRKAWITSGMESKCD
jgi:hypothetical protein